MTEKSNKTIRNKKINYTEPGKSTRNYKNKPLDERIGPRNSKQTNKIFSKEPRTSCIKGKRNARSSENLNKV